MEQLGHGGQVSVEVTLGAFGNTFTALCSIVSALQHRGIWRTNPCYQDVLGEARVGVLDLDEGELDAAVVKLVNQVCQLALCVESMSALLRHGMQHRRCVPPVVWTLRTLSLPASGWKALARGAETEKTAHCPKVGEAAAAPEGRGALMTPS